jgi:hypothetical protein
VPLIWTFPQVILGAAYLESNGVGSAAESAERHNLLKNLACWGIQIRIFVLRFPEPAHANRSMDDRWKGLLYLENTPSMYCCCSNALIVIQDLATTGAASAGGGARLVLVHLVLGDGARMRIDMEFVLRLSFMTSPSQWRHRPRFW